MSGLPFGRFWAEGVYRSVDLLGTWLSGIGFQFCHADQRGWLACEWYDRPSRHDTLPPQLLLVWDAGSAELDWVALAVPGVPSNSDQHNVGLHRRGGVLIPAPPQPPDPGAHAHHKPCDRHQTGRDGLWAVMTLDTETLSPQALQTALHRLAQTWQDSLADAARSEAARLRGREDIPDLPEWLLHAVASANENGELRVLRGTGGAYWHFNNGGHPGDGAAGFLRWVEEHGTADSATYDRTSDGGGLLTGTLGWASFYLASLSFDGAHGSERDEPMHDLVGLLHFTRKGVPRWHERGEKWVRPLTVVADRYSGVMAVRHRGPEEVEHTTDELATNLLTELLLGRREAGQALLQRVFEVVRVWQVQG